MDRIENFSNQYISFVAGDKSDVLWTSMSDDLVNGQNYGQRFVKAAAEYAEIPDLYSDDRDGFSFMDMITNRSCGRKIAPQKAHMLTEILDKYQLYDNNSYYRNTPSYPDFFVRALKALPKEKRKEAVDYLVSELGKLQKKMPEAEKAYQKKCEEERRKADENPRYRPHFPGKPSFGLNVDSHFFAEMMANYCKEKGYDAEQTRTCLVGFTRNPEKLERGEVNSKLEKILEDASLLGKDKKVKMRETAAKYHEENHTPARNTKVNTALKKYLTPQK